MCECDTRTTFGRKQMDSKEKQMDSFERKNHQNRSGAGGKKYVAVQSTFVSIRNRSKYRNIEFIILSLEMLKVRCKNFICSFLKRFVKGLNLI